MTAPKRKNETKDIEITEALVISEDLVLNIAEHKGQLIQNFIAYIQNRFEGTASMI